MKSRTQTLIDNRELHFIFGGGYVFCRWSGTIGYLVHNPQETRCDRCKLLVWQLWDESPGIEQARWQTGRVIRPIEPKKKVA